MEEEEAEAVMGDTTTGDSIHPTTKAKTKEVVEDTTIMAVAMVTTTGEAAVVAAVEAASRVITSPTTREEVAGEVMEVTRVEEEPLTEYIFR